MNCVRQYCGLVVRLTHGSAVRARNLECDYAWKHHSRNLPSRYEVSTDYFTYFILLNVCRRLAWFAGVGRKRYWYGQRGPAAKSQKKQ